MNDDQAVLVRVLAHQDAVRLPLRHWDKPAAANRYQMARLPGVPYRVNTAADAARKAGERRLIEMADAGLLVVSRGTRVKFPLVALTPAGDAAARSLAGRTGGCSWPRWSGGRSCSRWTAHAGCAGCPRSS